MCSKREKNTKIQRFDLLFFSISFFLRHSSLTTLTESESEQEPDLDDDDLFGIFSNLREK